jgi:hypothetical protein
VRQSGKNSADIRMVVDALDLCYTKPHVDTFVIISGDSDFSPLVSKLRENDKTVIGVGVKNSSSDLLIANCDEFIYYDDLVRQDEQAKGGRRRRRKKPAEAEKVQHKKEEREEEREASEDKEERKEDDGRDDDRKQEAIDLVLETADAMKAERSDTERLWGSMIKQALRRRRPGFNERYYGFGSFSELLEEAAARGLVELEPDERSGGYTLRRIVD